MAITTPSLVSSMLFLVRLMKSAPFTTRLVLLCQRKSYSFARISVYCLVMYLFINTLNGIQSYSLNKQSKAINVITISFHSRPSGNSLRDDSSQDAWISPESPSSTNASNLQ